MNTIPTHITSDWSEIEYIWSTASQVVVVCDQNTALHCGPLLLEQIPLSADSHWITLEAGEHNKHWDHLEELLGYFAALRLDTSACVVVLGGGVVSDLVGTACLLYKRGVSAVYIPTSLLSMVDACYGGKVAINFGGVKNMIGGFFYPGNILIDSQFLHTLPKRHWRNGLAEMLKHGMIADETHLNYLSNTYPNENPLVWQDAIWRSLEIKKEIVAKDPMDRGLRKSLNFGHTMGHALESYWTEQKKDVLHGEAIAYGMIWELCIAMQSFGLSKELFDVYKAIIDCIFLIDTSKVPSLIDLERILLQDKKNKDGSIRMALLVDSETVEVDIAVSLSQISDAWHHWKTL